jgi:hypothetical protein
MSVIGSTNKSLDEKLGNIHVGKFTSHDFIIADAKDADMAFVVMAPATHLGHTFGESGPGIYKTRQEFLEDMRILLRQGVLDIMLTSASNGEQLSKNPATFDKITLAVRGNDASDIWNPRGGNYPKVRSRPFQSVNLKVIKGFCDLVLYSVTFNNDLESDLLTLEEYKKFRIEAAELGIRHFLEVFNPNAPVGIKSSDIASFVSDHIIRTLAGVTEAERPIFLKVVYNGREALQELVQSDSSLVIGILGGSEGTTRDTFELLHRAESAGARVALFGRKIQRAESQVDIVRLMRPVLEGNLTPLDAVSEYHQSLEKLKIVPYRPLKDDRKITDAVLSAE